MIGVWQIVLIIFTIIFLFGSNKITHIMRDLARGIKVFKNEIDSDKDKDSFN